MRHIENDTDSLLGAVNEISSALNEQSASSTLIAQNVERIAQMTEENSSAIGSVSASGLELERLAQTLRDNVGHFKR